ncbi:MAG: RHS repeat-associated core domain-containing protein [Gemmatimonadales bacterium]
MSDGTNGSDWTFTHGPGTDDPVLGHYPGTVNRRAFFLTDGNGRQYVVADQNGTDLTPSLDYTQNGGKYAGGTQNASSFGADRQASSSVPGVSFFRNRIYDQATGRWTQEDPIGVAGGLNLYQFNGNNPVAYTDPFGLSPDNDCCDVDEAVAIGSGVGATAGAVVALACAGSTGGVCAAGAPAIVGVFTGIGASVGGLVGSVLQAAGNSGKTASGQTAAGKATDEYGNPLGPSGKPQVDNVDKSTRKQAKDAARDAGKGPPINHPSPARGKPHYHPTDADGNKLPGSPHYTYP